MDFSCDIKIKATITPRLGINLRRTGSGSGRRSAEAGALIAGVGTYELGLGVRRSQFKHMVDMQVIYFPAQSISLTCRLAPSTLLFISRKCNGWQGASFGTAGNHPKRKCTAAVCHRCYGYLCRRVQNNVACSEPLFPPFWSCSTVVVLAKRLVDVSVRRWHSSECFFVADSRSSG